MARYGLSRSGRQAGRIKDARGRSVGQVDALKLHLLNQHHNAVALDGERLVVASANDDDAGPSSGSVYLFDFQGAGLSETKLTAADAAPGDQFGWSVSASGEAVLVGAWLNDNRGADSGAAYLYAPGVLGDMDCDGRVTGADIDPFFLAVGDPRGYAAAYPNCNINRADVDRDGIISGADIEVFLVCVGNGGCP